MASHPKPHPTRDADEASEQEADERPRDHDQQMICALLDVDPGQLWRAGEVAAALDVEPTVAACQLATLAKIGDIERVAVGVYRSAHPRPEPTDDGPGREHDGWLVVRDENGSRLLRAPDGSLWVPRPLPDSE